VTEQDLNSGSLDDVAVRLVDFEGSHSNVGTESGMHRVVLGQ